MSELRRELEDFINHPGWKWFLARVDQEWGAQGQRYLAELDKALDLKDNDAAASQARQIRSGQKVILALLRAPQEEIAKLKALEQTTKVEHSARPAPSLALAGQSRRGSL